MTSKHNLNLCAMRMPVALAAFLLLLFLFPDFAMAQKKEKYSGIGFNKDKIELLYQNVNYTTTYSSGRSYSGTYKAPLLRINNAEPVDYDPYKLLPYMKECPSAKKEILAYQKTRKQSKEHFIKAFLFAGAGGVIGVVGAAVASKKNENLAGPIFGISFGTGIGLLVSEVIKSRKSFKKSTVHLENSVVFYNDKCYKAPTPVKTDSVAPAAPALVTETPKTEPVSPKNSGVVENYSDTFYYKLLRNDPKGVHFISCGLHVLEFDITNYKSYNYLVGADLYYQKSARFSIEGMFRTALVDNFSEDGTKGVYIEEDGVIQAGESADYKRAKEISALASFEFAHKDRQRKESIYIGSKTIGGADVSQFGSLNATQRISYSARVGVTDYNSVWYSVNGLPFATSQLPPPVVIGPGEVYQGEYDLSTAIAMVHSTALSVGVSRRVISDLDVELLNSKWKGKRKNGGISEWFADFSYAPSIRTGDVYQINGDPNTGAETIVTVKTDATRLNHTGWRVGFRSIYPNGLCLGLEYGQRPGPNAERAYLLISALYRLGKSLR